MYLLFHSATWQVPMLYIAFHVSPPRNCTELHVSFLFMSIYYEKLPTDLHSCSWSSIYLEPLIHSVYNTNITAPVSYSAEVINVARRATNVPRARW